MRLMNVTTGALEAFSDARIPKYAILSHTWGDNEVTFQELAQIQASYVRRGIPLLSSLVKEAEKRPSYAKIRYARSQAARDGCQYMWADTCCIDKSSSAELSEAINSMYRYYQQSAVCYAYLEDAPEDFPPERAQEAEDDLEDLPGREFVNVRWLKRGWTLQELLAPKQVVFYSKGWRYLGDKASLADWLVLATGIDRELLLDPSQLRRMSVARKMSFASKRETTRVEDIAYCLLGIFGVNLPLLYGEGENAFLRLQEEIMKYSDDQSLFAWKAVHDWSEPKAYGIFARHPSLFAESGNIVPISTKRSTAPFTMTNRGLQIDLPVLDIDPSHPEETDDKQYLGLLDCQYEDDFTTCLAMTLRQTHISRVFVRLQSKEHSVQKVTPESAARAVVRTMYIPRDFVPVKREYINCQVRAKTLEEHGYTLVKALRPTSRARSRWNPESQVFRVEAAEHGGMHVLIPHVTFIFFNSDSGLGFAVQLDLQHDDARRVARISRLREHAWDSAVLTALEMHRQSDNVESNVSINSARMSALTTDFSRRPHGRYSSGESLDLKSKTDVAAVISAQLIVMRAMTNQIILTADTHLLTHNRFLYASGRDVEDNIHDLSNRVAEKLKVAKNDYKPLLVDRLSNRKAYVDSILPGRNDWYTILEQDANKGLKKTSTRLRSLEDGSRVCIDISCNLERQDIFDQKLYVLTVEMEHVRNFEME